MSDDPTNPPAAPAGLSGSGIPTAIALALAPQLLGAVHPLLIPIFSAGLGQWQSYQAAKNLPPDHVVTDATLADFESFVAANTPESVHARARAQVAAEGTLPRE